MKKNNIVLFGIAVLCACSVPKERQPLTGGQWGEIKNEKRFKSKRLGK